MRFVSADEIRRVLDFDTLIAALEAGHRRPPMPVHDDLLGGAGAQYFVRSSGAAGFAFGSKLITIVPDNPTARDLPTVQALYVLFDGDDGRPRAVLDGTELTYWKTAADSALGAKLLAPERPRVLAVAGAGQLAPWLVRAHCHVNPSIERVQVWNRSLDGAQRLAVSLRADGVAAEATADLAAAVSEADIVTTATMAETPILEGAWLTPGTHVDLVGGYSLTTREADDTVVTAGRLFVDCRESALGRVGDIAAPIEAGVLGEADILGDLYDLCAGAPGRVSSDDITVFKNAGGAHLDLMTADAVLSQMELSPLDVAGVVP